MASNPLDLKFSRTWITGYDPQKAQQARDDYARINGESAAQELLKDELDWLSNPARRAAHFEKEAKLPNIDRCISKTEARAQGIIKGLWRST